MCRPYIDTNNPQDMQLGRFKNCTPARFEYIYCTLFPLCHSNQDMYPFLKDASFCPFLFCAYDSSVLQNFKIFTHLLPNFSYKDPRLTEVTYHCINFNDRVRKVQIKIYSCPAIFENLGLSNRMNCSLKSAKIVKFEVFPRQENENHV